MLGKACDDFKDIWGGNRSGGKKDKFLATKFRAEIKELMEELEKCDVHFIRCIKPNEIKKPDHFCDSFVM
jgi:myosin heavy subunit